MAELFGFEFSKRSKKKQDLPVSFVAPTEMDGATASAQANTTSWNFDAIYEDQKDQINLYRDMAMDADVSSALDEIVNDAIVIEPNKQTAELAFVEKSSISENIKKKMIDEFDNIANLMNFDQNGDGLFRTWYVDGQIYFHIVTNKNDTEVVDIRFIDPRHIRKVKDVIKEKDKNNVDVVKRVDEYYIYTDPKEANITKSRQEAIKIPAKAIIHVTSNLSNGSKGEPISYLHPAIKPHNQLRHMEDALVIYRSSRATERRVFYIDVGNMPKTAAEQYMKSISNKHTNKITYNTATGSVKNTKNTLSMMEDLFIPRRDGSRGTEVDTLPGGGLLGDIIDVEYFRKKLMKSLRVPISRLETETSFTIGNASEITRDEIKFSKFIVKLRNRFSGIFKKSLKTQLILKKIITEDDWEAFSGDINFKYNTDSHFAELKQIEIINNRMDTLSSIDEYVGRYFSVEYIRRNVLNQSEEEMKTIDDQIVQEKKDGKIDDGA